MKPADLDRIAVHGVDEAIFDGLSDNDWKRTHEAIDGALWLCSMAWAYWGWDLPPQKIHPSAAKAWAEVRAGTRALPKALRPALEGLEWLRNAGVRDRLCRKVMPDKSSDDAVNALSIAINERADALLAAIDETSDPAACIEALASTLESIGDKGKANAEVFRGADPSWRPWLGRIDKGAPNYPSFALAIAVALWVDVVGPVQAERQRKRAGIVTATYYGALQPMMERQLGFDEMDDGVIRNDRGKPVAVIAEGANRLQVRNGLSLFQSVHAHKLVRRFVLDSHEQWINDQANPHRLVYSGGLTGLADAIGYRHKDTKPLHDILEAGYHIEWTSGAWAGKGLWAISVERGRRGKTGRVAVTLLDPLSPGAAADLRASGKNSRSARAGRLLVPELRFDVPVGRTRMNEQGPIWTLHRRFMVEMVERSQELAKHGAIAISSGRWRELAIKAGVPVAILDRVLGAWVDGDSDAAPALVERDGDTWTLADAHAPERDFIIDGGKRRGRGRERGKRSARKRSGKRPRA